MSLNRITKLLNALGFSNIDAEIYIYIAKLGPLSDEEIANRLKLKLERIVPILEELVKKGVIIPTIKNKKVYSSLSFEELLDEFVKFEISKAEEIRKNNQKLISTWKNLTEINKK